LYYQVLRLQVCDACQLGLIAEMKANRVPKNDSEGKAGGGTLVAMVAVFILAFAFFVWGLGSGTHVAGNPGPIGMPESTIVNQAPPPAGSPSGTTTGTAR
ncbi:hypothetical protein, partial [Bradyrhizobium sp.]|uniref:hypothetical protein n=1 Tax=Bradyrhizobium sp. TaxID=376 RepID=UPI0025C4D304